MERTGLGIPATIEKLVRSGFVERGELSPEDFMAGITAMLSDLVQSYRNVSVTSALSWNLTTNLLERKEAEKFKPVCEGRAVQPGDHLAAAEMSVEDNYNQIDGIINNEVPRPSLLDILRQCQEDAGKSQSGTAPSSPSRDPER